MQKALEMASNLIQSRYSLNSVGSSTTTSMMSLSSDDYGDRNIFSPRPSSPTHGNQGMGLDADPNSPESMSPSVSPLPPRHNYSLAHHITMEENVTDNLQVPYDNNGSRNRAMSESNYNENRNLKRGESFSSVASSTDSAKARVSSRNSRNMRRVKSCKNTSRCGSSMSRQSGSTSSLNKKPLADNKVRYKTKESNIVVEIHLYSFSMNVFERKYKVICC